MNLVAYNFGPVSSHKPNHSVSEVSNPCELPDICPQNHSLEKHGDLQNDSINVSKSYSAMGFIRSDVTTNIMPKTCFERANRMANHRINKVDQQLMDSASKECFMNTETLSTQLQNLIPLGTLDAHPHCEASSSLRTGGSPIWKTGGAQGLLPDLYNLSSPYVSVGHLMNLGAGSPFCNQGISSICDAFDGINIISPLGIRPIPDQVIPSPEQISSVTACSDGDLHSNGELFDTGGTFPCSTLIRVLQSSSDNCVTVQNVDQGELNSIDSGVLLDNNQNLHHVPFPSPLVENEELAYSNACILEQVSEIIPDGSNVLSGTVVNKSRSNHEELEYRLQVMGGQQFYQWPVRELYSTETAQSGLRNLKNHPLRDRHGWDCSSTGSSAVELTQPPSKRMRIENFSFSKNGHFNQGISSEDQVLRSEESSHLGKWSDSPLCNKDNAEDMKKKHLSSVGNPVKPLVTCNQKSDIPGVQFSNVPVLCEELNSGCKSFGSNNANACKITSIGTNHSQGLVQGIMPLPERPNFIQEKEVTFVSKPDQPESKGEEDSTENAADRQSGTNSEGPMMLGVSLTDCFTAKQIKEHLCSLNPQLGQCITRGGKASTTEYSVGDNACQLCSVDKFAFSPAQISCSSCGADIKRNLIYYWTLDGRDTRHCFCTKCFKESRGGNILFQGLSISKGQLRKEKNNEEIEESWVQCDKCERWQHQICTLYNAKKDPDGKAKYICPLCRLQEMRTGQHAALPAAFGAKDLPPTILSDHIEERLFRKLKTEREERAKKLGKSFDEVPGASDLFVRVVLSVDKQLKVKQQFLDIFPNEDYPAEFQYKSKVILLFQKIDGVDVCLFAMYVQEFGSECGQPNRRCIYVSYLDSVKYFRPEIEAVTGEALRTFVYQEILIGYLDYCKKRGFGTCYIWACPPRKGEDYILHCHPETQKTPKPEKLRKWYKSMLGKAVKDRIVLDYTNLYDNFFIPNGDCKTKVTAARLPYFDGDYWSEAAENMIRTMENQSGGESEMKVKRLLTKRTLKAMGHNDLTADATKDILVMQKLGQAILPCKEDFIIAHLHSTCVNCHEVILSGGRWVCSQCENFRLRSRCINVEQDLNVRKTHMAYGEEQQLSQIMVKDIPADTAEEDVILDNDILQNRHSFLNFCQGNHYQFDTLRRAKHSSMMILYHLHKQAPATTGTICSICLKDVLEEAGWHCEICPKFNVCSACYHRNGEGGHDHKLIQRLIKAECGVNSKQAQQQKTNQDPFDVLVHASKCFATKGNPCSYRFCVKIKKIFHHSTQCTVRLSGGCKICSRVWLLLRRHSRTCKDPTCRVPRCMDLKKHAEMHSAQSHLCRSAAVKGLNTA